jgi:hypothetical protein
MKRSQGKCSASSARGTYLMHAFSKQKYCRATYYRVVQIIASTLFRDNKSRGNL